MTNTGIIASGTYNAAAITLGGNYGAYLAAGGTVTNGASGGTVAQNAASQIEGGAQAGIYSNAALMLTNYGAISSNGTGTVDAVTIQGTATVINTGTITAATGGASGIAFVGTGSSITNSGKITGGNSTTYGYGVQAAGAAAGSITNQAGGTITASLGGIGRVGTGAVAIDNSGVVTGTGSTSYGVNVTGGTGTITNRSGGVVVGQTDGILSSAALNVSNAGTIGTGTLSGTMLTTAGVYGLQLAGATNAVTNTGTISTGAAGIFASAGTLALTNTGTISSGNTYGGNTQDAVYANGTSTILNAGLITDATRAGMAATPTYSAINLIGASTVTNASAGVLTGGSDATFGEAIQFHAAGTFNNYGSATGTGNGAVYQTSNAATVVNLFAGSTTGNITLQGGNDTVSLYTGTTNAAAVMQGYTDAVSGTAGTVVLQAAGTLQQAAIGTIALGGGTNTFNLMGAGTGTIAGSVNLANVTGATTLNKTDTGTWTLTGADASPAATINAGNGTPSGLLIFSGSGLTGAVYVNGATIRATTAAGFGTGTVYEQDPTTQFAYNGTNANNFVLASTAPTTDPTVFQTYGTGITATLTGTITETNAPQPLTFGSIATNNAANSGTFVLANAGNTWTGTTTIAGGAGYATTLQGTTATISGGAIVDNGVLYYNQTTAGSVNVAISGSGLLVKDGTGTVTLTQHDSYSGGTNVLAGTLVAATVNGSYAADALGSGTVAIATGATVQYANPYTTGAPGPSSAQIYTSANTFTGGGTLAFTGATGSLTVIDHVNGTADVAMAAGGLVNVQSGSVLARGTNVFAGNQAGLTIAAGASFDGGSGAAITVDALNGGGSYVGNGALTVGVAGGSGSFAGTIGNENGATTSLTKAGAGTETLSGANTYSGATSITGGTLALSGSGSIANSSVAVSTGATFDISTLTGGTSVVSLTGAGATALGVNTLTLTNAGGTYAGTITGTGGLTVAGGTFTYGASDILDDRATLTVNGGATVNLAGYSDTVATLNLYGTLENGGLLTAATYNAFAGSTIGQSISTGTLNVYGNTSLTAATAATPVNVYAGTLSTASAELLSDTGAVNIASGGTLALGGNETIGSLGDLAYNGTTNGGTVQLGQYTLSAGGANTSTSFSGIVTGTGGLTKTGTGTLTLSGANTYTGTTTVSGGTLQGSTTSIAGSTIVDNATLAYNQAASGTVAQAISGSGVVTVTGLAAGNALTFGGANSQAGGFAVTDASIVAFTGTANGADTEVTLQGAGTLVNTGTIAGTTTGVAAIGTSGTTTVTNASTGTISGASYGVQSSGAGALLLTNYGTITGAVSALSTGANTLSLRAGSTTGAVTTGSGNDTLALYTGFIAANPVVDATTGLTLRPAGTYAAAAFGAIDLGAGANVLNLRGMGDGSQANGAAGSIDLSTVANAGTITKQDAGTWTLAGAVTDAVTSAATINAGIGGTPGSGGLLVFSGSGLTGTINVNGATIRATAAGAFGTGTINAIDPTIQYAATGTYANPIVLQSANPATDPTTLQTFGAGITATLSGAITEANAPQPLVFSSINTDGTQGTGTFVLTNAGNAWTGVTTVNAGTTLRGTTATLSGASFTDNGVVNFNQATAGTSARAISGSGVVLIDGGGPVTLTGAITATGGVQIGANTTATLSNVSGNGNTTVSLSGANAVLNVAQGGTITATNGGAVFGTAQNGTVTNAGTITSTGNFNAVYFNPNLGTATVTNTGNVNAFGSAITAGAGTTLTVNNTGTLTSVNRPAILAAGVANLTNGAAGTINGFFGVYANGALTLNNAGQITAAGTGGNAVTANGGGTIVNTGTLTATTAGGWGVQISGAGSVDNQGIINADSGLVATTGTGVSFSNEGMITGITTGVLGYNGTGVTLTNTGTITGGVYGVQATAAGSTITNSGTIAGSASGAVGVYLTGGTLTNQSGGTISAGQTNGVYGIAIQLAGTGNILNLQAGSTVNGSIDASATTDASNSYTFTGTLNGGFTGGSGNDTVTLVTPVTVTGTLDGGAGTDTLVLDGTGTGTLGSAQVVNFENGMKQGSGTWTLTGTTAASPTSFAINAGTLAVAGGNALSDTGAITIASGATLQLNASETIGSLGGAGNVTLGANTLTTGGLNASPTFSGVASGTGGLTKVGTGTLTLAGANTYTGATTVNAGTLALGTTNAIAAGSAVTVASGATLDLATYNDTVANLALAGTLNGTGTLTAATYTLNGAAVNANLGAGTLTQAGGTSTLSGTAGAATVNVAAGTLALGASNRLADNATVTIASGATLNLGANSDTVGLVGIAGTLNGTGTLTAAEYDLSGAVVNGNLGTGNVFQQAGTSTLNGTSGAANVMVTGGTLTLGASNRLADTAAVGVASGATLNLGANTDTVGSLALNGTLAGTGTLTAATYTLNAAAVNANLGTGTLVQASGTSVLSGTAATTTVAVMAGTLRLGASDRIADTAMLGVASGATFDLASYNETVGTLAGSGTLSLGAGTLTSGGTNADYAFSGNVTGAGDLTKVGSGTFSLMGNEALTGRLNVNAGTLMLAGTTAGSVRVQGGTLTGASTIAGNLLLSSGTLSPGIATQPVAMIQAGSLTVTGGTTVFDFGGMASGFTADLLKVTGAATLTGGTVTTRALDPSAAYKMEQIYTVLQAGTLTGTYASGTAFTQVSNDSDLYYRLRYDLVPNGVVLEVRKTVDFTTTLGTGATGNELAVARALNGGLLTGSDAFATALNAISQLTPDQRRATLDNIGGESVADISTSVAMMGNRFNELLRQRVAVGGAGNSADPSLIAGIAGGKRGLDQVRASGQVGAEGSSFADGSKDNHAGAWVQTFGGAGRLDGSNGTASINDQSYGVAAGIDAKVAGFSIGGAFAASALDTRVEGRNATNRGTLYQGGGYVAYDDGQVYASAVGSYFSGTVTSARQVYIGTAFQGTATGTPKVTGYTAGGAAGYRLPIGGGVRFTPQVSIEATHVDRDAFTETGAGVLSLAAGKDVRNLYTATVEGRLSHLSAAPGGIIEPYAGAGVAFNFGDLSTVSANQFTGAPTGTGAFSIAGARLSPTTALINGGIEAHPNDRVTLGMGVETRLSNRERDGRLELHVRLGF